MTTPEQRRISALESRIKRLQRNFVSVLFTGMIAVPILLKIWGLVSDPVLRLQLGVALAVFLTGAGDWLRTRRETKREAALRQQEFIESVPELTKTP